MTDDVLRALRIEPAGVVDEIEAFIRHYLEYFHRDGVVLGMSGGVDSAVVASLATRAVGCDRVLALLLPERDSSPDSEADALLEIKRLGIRYRKVDLTPVLSAVGIYDLLPLRILGVRRVKAAVVRHQHQVQAEALGEMPFQAGLLGTRDLDGKKGLIDAGNAYGRVKHRMRLLTLYYAADLENRLVLGTTNKSESSVGFVVKWGDNVADVEPILPLYKTQVFQLARYLGVSERVIAKAPSPDLLPGIVDELAMGIEYATLDRILVGLERDWDTETIVHEMRVTVEQVEHVREMARRSEHLRTLPPHPELTA
jgi:NAD+ synthase